jgi:hypothetical protein
MLELTLSFQDHSTQPPSVCCFKGFFFEVVDRHTGLSFGIGGASALYWDIKGHCCDIKKPDQPL